MLTLFKMSEKLRGQRAQLQDKTLDPLGVAVRESRDSADNPNSTPLIVALDVTGSMGMGEISALDETGDTKTIWDTDKPDEVEVAREQFDKLKKKGYVFYTVKKNGEQGEVMHKFDPEAGKMIAVPRVVGG